MGSEHWFGIGPGPRGGLFGAHVVDDAAIRIILGVPLTVIENSGVLRLCAQGCKDSIASMASAPALHQSH